jgi:hypothetical protein
VTRGSARCPGAPRTAAAARRTAAAARRTAAAARIKSGAASTPINTRQASRPSGRANIARRTGGAGTIRLLLPGSAADDERGHSARQGQHDRETRQPTHRADA